MAYATYVNESVKERSSCTFSHRGNEYFTKRKTHV